MFGNVVKYNTYLRARNLEEEGKALNLGFSSQVEVKEIENLI